MNKVLGLGTGLLLVIVVGGLWLALRQPAVAPLATPQTTPENERNNELGTAESGEEQAVKAFTVTGASFSFDPAEIRVRKGDKVRLTFTSQGGQHDWRLDELKAATALLGSGQSETIEFVATTSGQFEYYCSVGTHRQMGMKGTLFVE